MGKTNKFKTIKKARIKPLPLGNNNYMDLIFNNVANKLGHKDNNARTTQIYDELDDELPSSTHHDVVTGCDTTNARSDEHDTKMPSLTQLYTDRKKSEFDDGVPNSAQLDAVTGSNTTDVRSDEPDNIMPSLIQSERRVSLMT